MYLPLLSTVSYRLFFFLVSLTLLGMTLWSLPRAVFSNPGYLGADFHVGKVMLNHFVQCPKERAQEAVNAMNLKHYQENGLVDYESLKLACKVGRSNEG